MSIRLASGRSARATIPRSWWLLFAVCVTAAAVVEAALLELSTSYFTSGYNAVYLDDVPTVMGFFAAGAVLDAALALGVWAALVPVLRIARLGALQIWCVAGLFAMAIPFAYDLVRYQILAILGRMVGVSLLWEVSGRSSTEVASQAASYLSPLLIIATGFGFGFVLVLAVSGWVERRLADGGRSFAPPPIRMLAAAFLVCAVAATGVLFLAAHRLDRIRHGLVNRPSGVLLSRVIQRVTDFDRDGAGLLSRPGDPAPFDPSIHPWALERPGNGVDEDGVGGDLAPRFEPPGAIPPTEIDAVSSPHVLLVFLESFRTDLIGLRANGREVTPFLNRLGREGAISLRAYVHSPFTVPSRAQLAAGTLVAHPGQPTLIDDFKGRGYRVGWFSGQDDSFGGSEDLLGVARADAFYDARQDIDRRTMPSTSPASLQISWKLLNERTLAFLAGEDPDVPLFLYVNLVDTHFPYDHVELDRILDNEPIPRGDIRASRAAEVWETYLNTTANVDRAVEQLVEAWWKHVGERPNAIVITADHGQSFYETGFLGHGQDLDQRQTGVPLILWGLGGEWPEPMGLGELRWRLWSNLDADRASGLPRARFVPDPAHRIFQYVAHIDRPELVALRSLERAVVWDFRSGRLREERANDSVAALTPAEREAAQRELIWAWEAHRLHAQAEAASDSAALAAQ